MSNLYGVRGCQGNNIEAPVRMNELLIQGWGGPSVAKGDHLRRHGRSWGDQIFHRGRSGGTNFGGDRLSRDRSTRDGAIEAKVAVRRHTTERAGNSALTGQGEGME